MRVLFDAYWWKSGPPSGRNVVRSIIQAWAKEFAEDHITIVVPRSDAVLAESELKDWGLPGVVVRSTTAKIHAVAAMTLSGEADVVVTQNFASLRRFKGLKCAFVHDYIFVEHPEWFTRRERLYLWPVRALSRMSGLIVTSSRSEAARIRRYSPRTAPVAVGLALAKDYETSVASRPAVHPEHYVLAVGRINVRKNLERLITALVDARIATAERPLVVVGSADGKRQRESSGGSVAVIWTGSVPDAELKWWYGHADAFVFPSLDEGFGLPVLEAATEGTPLALSDIPPFRDLGFAAEFFDPRDPESIAAAVGRAVDHRQAPGAPNATWRSVVSNMRAAVLERVDA